MAVFGNFLVCFVIFVNRHLRCNPTNLFIFSLALSDFLAATIVMAVLLTMAVSSFLNVILPLMITCFFYFLIYRIAVKNNRSTKRGTFPWTWKPFKDEKKVYLRNVKAAKTTSMFVLALFFCWQPYFYFSLLVLSTPKTGNRFLTKFSWYYWCSIWSSWFEYRKATTLQIRIFPKHLYRSVR